VGLNLFEDLIEHLFIDINNIAPAHSLLFALFVTNTPGVFVTDLINTTPTLIEQRRKPIHILIKIDTFQGVIAGVGAPCHPSERPTSSHAKLPVRTCLALWVLFLQLPDGVAHRFKVGAVA